MKVSEALKKIQKKLEEDSGYPLNTVKDSGEAFAYGLTIGVLGKLVEDWETREWVEQRRAKGDDGV